MHFFTEPPPNFHATVEVAGCFCTYRDKVLFLKRNPHAPQGNTWCVPAGKLEPGENPRAAAIREVREEVGLDIDTHDLREIGHLYAQLPHMDYIFHIFYKPFITQPTLALDLNEHSEAKWVTPAEAEHLSLILGGKEALRYFMDLR